MSVKLKFKDSQGTNIPYDIEANNLSVTNMPLIKGKTCDWVDAKANYVTTASLNNALSANIRTKVLSSGVYHMNENQTISLSEAVSAQPNGIILVFSLFTSSGTVLNYGWACRYVSKNVVSLYNGAGHGFIFHDGADMVGSKYLYITDTTIRGYSYNSKYVYTSSNNKALWNNGNWVLRYVLGY